MPRSSSVPSLEPPCRQDIFNFPTVSKDNLAKTYAQDIMAKRNQKPEVRKAQREQAVRAAKDQKKATVKKPAVKVRPSLLVMDLESCVMKHRSCFKHSVQIKQ